jgi:hypothetical protein
VPKPYEALLEAALRIKERVADGLPVRDRDFAQWELDAFRYFNRAERIVQIKRDEDQDADREKNAPKNQPGRGWESGDSLAFKWTDDQKREMYEAQARRNKKRDDAKKKADLIRQASGW